MGTVRETATAATAIAADNAVVSIYLPEYVITALEHYGDLSHCSDAVLLALQRGDIGANTAPVNRNVACRRVRFVVTNGEWIANRNTQGRTSPSASLGRLLEQVVDNELYDVVGLQPVTTVASRANERRAKMLVRAGAAIQELNVLLLSLCSQEQLDALTAPITQLLEALSVLRDVPQESKESKEEHHG